MISQELYDILSSDIYTDDSEYRDRVQRIRELLPLHKPTDTPAAPLPASVWIATHSYTGGAELFPFDHHPTNKEIKAAILAKHPHVTIEPTDVFSVAFVPLPAPGKPCARRSGRKVKFIDAYRVNGSENVNNKHRASWGGAALELYRQLTGISVDNFDHDAETYVSDILGDLMHWCRLNGISFPVETAQARFNEECAEDGNGGAKVPPAKQETPEQLLERAAEIQSQLWQTVRQLEKALGIEEISTTADLSNETVESLREGGDDE